MNKLFQAEISQEEGETSGQEQEEINIKEFPLQKRQLLRAKCQVFSAIVT